jgi:hypothetical protein
MAKVQSEASLLLADESTHTIYVKVLHYDYTSWSRSVIPSANKVYDKFMRSEKGKEWLSAGFCRFEVHPDYGVSEEGDRCISVITYRVSQPSV